MATPTVNRLYFLRQDRTTGLTEKDPATGYSVLWKAPEKWTSILYPADLEGAGFQRVVVQNPEDYLNGACGPDTTGAPTAKPITPPKFAVGDAYKYRFTLADLATPAAGTTLTGVTLSAQPLYMTLTSESSSSGTIYQVATPPVPAGTTVLPFTLTVQASNGKSVPIVLKAQPKGVDEVTIVGYWRDNFDSMDINVGPAAETPPVYSFAVYPAGFTDFGAKNMTPVNETTFEGMATNFFARTNGGIVGRYVIQIVHLGQTLYGEIVRTGLRKAVPFTFTSTVPDGNPGGVTSPTWTPFVSKTLKQGEYFFQFLLQGYTPTGELDKVEVIGTPPSGFVIAFNSNGTPSAEWNIPLSQAPGNVSVKVRITQTNGQTVDNTFPFVIQAVSMLALIDVESSALDRVWLAPKGYGAPSFQVVSGPPTWTDFNVYNFDEWDANLADGKTYNYRMRKLKFTAGNFIVKYSHVQEQGKPAIVQYSSFAGPIGSYVNQQLSDTQPQPSNQVFYTATVDNGGVNEGSSTYIRALRYVSGQSPTPASGVNVVLDNPRPGTAWDTHTGLVVVDFNSTVSDSYVQDFHLELAGQNVYAGNFAINDTTGITAEPIDPIDHSNETTQGFYTSNTLGNVQSIVYTGQTNIDEGGVGIEATAKATLSDGSIITDLSQFKIYLATETGAFTQATTSGSAYISGVRLGSNGHMTADSNTVVGDTKIMRVKFEYGSLNIIQPITINDKTAAPTQVITKVWLRRDVDTSGNANLRLAVQGVGKFDYKPNTSNPLLYDWAGFILPVASAPVGNVGTSLSVPVSLLTSPLKLNIRLTDFPATIVTVDIPTATSGLWNQVYPITN